MIFADETFYNEKYLLGRTAIISPPDVHFWLREASNRINWRNSELKEAQITDALRLCTCAVAEALYVNSEKEFMSMEPSQSVGAYSKGAVNAKQEQGDFNTRLNGIINDHLAGTSIHNLFVYRGA